MRIVAPVLDPQILTNVLSPPQMPMLALVANHRADRFHRTIERRTAAVPISSDTLTADEIDSRTIERDSPRSRFHFAAASVEGDGTLIIYNGENRPVVLSLEDQMAVRALVNRTGMLNEEAM